MANMLNRARKARKNATAMLRQTESYVNGIDENGKKVLYRVIDELKESIDEINIAVGGIDNILPEYEDTPNKNEMMVLLGKLHERLELIESYLR